MLEAQIQRHVRPAAADAVLAEGPPSSSRSEGSAAVEGEPIEPTVARLKDVDAGAIDALLSAYGARLVKMEPGREIPGSYWGESEAGLIENDVFARADTPVHSLLHELCHFICMDRRAPRAARDGRGR